MFHKVKSVIPKDDFFLHVEFEDGLQKKYDVKPLFDEIPIFNILSSDDSLFNNVHVDVGGYGICWNDALDLSCNELYANGTIIKSLTDCTNENIKMPT